MDTDQASEQMRTQREIRRKKILDNAKSRMEKLKRLQERSSTSQKETTVADGEPISVNHAVPEHYVEDPPDEIIKRVPPSIMSQPLQSSNTVLASQPSFLCCVVATVKSDSAFRVRTLLGLFFSLILTIVTEFYSLSFSYLIAMLLMELTVLVAIAMVSKSDASSMKGDWILQLKGFFALLHPLLPNIFEVVYLSLYISTIVLKDLMIMIFGVVICKSVTIIVQS